MDNYRPPKVNRYWKRPKPKVYECNIRDAERFYQESYKHYLSEKEEAAAKAARARSIDTDKIEFYPHLRAGPIRRGSPSSRPPVPPSPPEGFRSHHDTDRSSAEISFTSRLEGLPTYDSSKDNFSIEERLERLKRLRAELGMPSDTKTGYASSSAVSTRSDSATRTTGSGLGDFETYKSERTSRSVADGTPDEASYTFKSQRTSRMNGTGGLGEDYKLKTEVGTDDYKFKSERSTDDYKSRSDHTNDYKLPSRSVEFELPRIERKPLTLSPKLDRKKDDYSFKSSTEKKADRFSSLSSAGSSSSATGRSSRKVIADLEIDDDDTSVVDMMKKLPSSQDILERISKMDLDD
ncbi:uncharacterized protein [Cherax quadricarinatus]|uniref:uncharacterized protein n=1 Tax=Cherax quadricarinatus TaxID=27406 RepID=UPI002379480E|nr:uncharacterized protein LOC128694888 [Cherax quadricarinatus]